MGLNGKLSENVHRLDGELTIGEMKRREDEWRDAQPIVTRCAFCPWTYDGPAGAGRDQAAAHRKAKHPAARRLTHKERERAREKTAVDQATKLRDTRDRREKPAVLVSVKPPAHRPAPKPAAAKKPKAKAVKSAQQGVPKPSPYGATLEERQARVITDIQTLGRELGRPPSYKDAGHALVRRARYTLDGTWADAVEAAGFPRPSRGTRYTERPVPANYGEALREIAKLQRLLRDARASRDRWQGLYRGTAPARALEARWKAA